MKNYKRQGKNAVFILFFIWIDFVLMSTSMTWTNYRFEGQSSEVRCIPNETRFFKDGVFDTVSCGKTCFEDNECMSFNYHPGSHQCIGCQTFQTDPLRKTSTGFLQFSRRQFQIDCKDILERKPATKSGVYEIKLSNSKTVPVYCDMGTDGGGWTVFQNRFDGSVNFRQNFSAYENGFGNLDGEFWLGLKYIQELTVIPSEVRYDIYVDSYEGHGHETYRGFQILGPAYTLSIDDEPLEREGFATKALFALKTYQRNDFSATERDTGLSCEGGGWWYLDDSDAWCNYQVTLNMLYGGNVGVQFEFDDRHVKWHKIKMMFRRNDLQN